MRQRLEHHDLVDTVQELGLELHLQLLDHLQTRLFNHFRRNFIAVESRSEILLNDLCPHVGGHDDNRIAEIDRTPLVIGKPSVVEHLQQDVEHVGMRLLDLIEQHDRIRLAPHSLGQLSALVVTDISRRRTDQTRHAVTLLVLAHVDTGQHVVVVEEELGQRLRQLGLTYTRRTQEDERADRLAGIVQSGPRTAHGIRHGGNGQILTDYAAMQLLLHVEQLLTLGSQHTRNGNPRPAGYHLGHILGIDLLLDHRPAGRSRTEFVLKSRDLLLGLLNLAVTNLGHTAVIALPFSLLSLDLQVFDPVLVLLDLLQHVPFAFPLGTKLGAFGPQLLDLMGQLLDTLLVVLAADRLALDLELTYPAIQHIDLLRHGVHLQAEFRSRLVDQVDRLIGQETGGDVALRKFDGRNDRLVLDPHLMVVLVTILQSAQDRNRILGRRFIDHDFLKTTLERLVLLEIFLELVERRSTDRTQLTARQGRFENIGGIHRTRRLAGSDQRMNFVDEEQYLALAGGHLLHDGLQTLLELTLVLGPGDQRAHVERIDHLRAQVLRHVPVHDPVGDTLRNGRLTHAGFSDQHRIVFGTARKNLQYTANLLVAADDRIELAAAGHLVQIDRILAQGIELLRRRLRIDGRPLAEHPNRLEQLLFSRPGAFQQIGGSTPLGDQSQQQMLYRSVLVPEILGKIDGTLDYFGRILRKELFAASRNMGQPPHGPLHFAAQSPHVYADTPQQKYRQRIVLAHEHIEQMQRFDGLIALLPGKRHRSLQRLLRLNS